MNKKRLIFTLLVDEGKFLLSRNFSLQEVGDLDWLFNTYHANSLLHSIDELVVLNVSKDLNQFPGFIELLENLSARCFMPIAAGGQIRHLSQAKALFHAGADKVILNTALFTDAELVAAIANHYGKQSVVASIDYRLNNERCVYIDKGQQQIEMPFSDVMHYLSHLPVGELYLTSIERDGTGRGYDIEGLEIASKHLSIPIIASGGVGRYEHLIEGAKIQNVTGLSTANLFNFIGDGLQKARDYLFEQGMVLAKWSYQQVDDLKNENNIVLS